MAKNHSISYMLNEFVFDFESFLYTYESYMLRFYISWFDPWIWELTSDDLIFSKRNIHFHSFLCKKIILFETKRSALKIPIFWLIFWFCWVFLGYKMATLKIALKQPMTLKFKFWFCSRSHQHLFLKLQLIIIKGLLSRKSWSFEVI